MKWVNPQEMMNAANIQKIQLKGTLRRFLTKLTEKGEGALGSLWGWALHHYSWNTSRGATTDWTAGKGDAVQFSTDEWYELLNEADRMDGLISGIA